MYKLVLAILAIFATFTFTNAQEIADDAIGLRIGDDDGFGTEISYQRTLGDTNRLELDLGWRSGSNYDGFKVTGLYQWVWHLDGNFNWYAGAGGGIATYNLDVPNNSEIDDTFLFIAGDVGVEYNFDIPLQVSLDIRPELGFSDIRDNLGIDLAISFRYRF